MTQGAVEETVQFICNLQAQFASGATDTEWLRNLSGMVYRCMAHAAASVICVDAALVCYKKEYLLLPAHAELVSSIAPLVAYVQLVAQQICNAAVEAKEGITESAEEIPWKMWITDFSEIMKETKQIKENVLRLSRGKKCSLRRVLLDVFDIAEAESRAAKGWNIVYQAVSSMHKTMDAIQSLAPTPTLYTERITKE
jgi:hypothetical protein